MSLLISCKCGKKLKVRDELAGKKIKCPGCGAVIATTSVQAPDSPPAPPPLVKPPPLPVDELPEVEEEPITATPAETANDAAHAEILHWRCPDGFRHRLLVLTEAGFLHLAGNDKVLNRAEEALTEGEDMEEALGADAKFIEFSQVKSITTNKNLPGMTVTHKTRDDSSGKEEDASEVFTFPDRKDRDRALKVLRGWLEPEWQYERKDYTPLEASVAPLVTIAVLLVITLGLAGLAHWLSTWTGSARVPAWAAFLYHTMMFLGPVGVILVGLVFIVPCIIWLLVRVRTPPIMLTLKPKRDAAGE